MAIYARDGFCCVWCGARRSLSLDHLWRPVEGRYDNRSGSLVTACKHCNDRRGGRRLGRWLRDLRDRGELPDLGQLRRRLRQPIDLEAGRALLLSPTVRRARHAAGAQFRREEWPSMKEEQCPPF